MYNLVAAVRFDGSGFPCTAEHLVNQERAQKSWGLLGCKWTCLARVGHVYCHELVEELVLRDVAAHIDADIILTAPVCSVFEFIQRQTVPAMATSHRYCFDSVTYPNFSDDAQIVHPADTSNPYGVSIFIGNRLFWERWLSVMSKTMSRFGVCDDQALLAFGNSQYPESVWDFTKLKCVFHPNHVGRDPSRGEFNTHIEMDTAAVHIPRLPLLEI